MTKKPMQKWGKDARGKPRFRCKFCKVSKTRKRSDLNQKYKKILFSKWLLGKNSLTEISEKYNVSTKTIYRWFVPFWNEKPQVKSVNISNKVVIIDGKYITKNGCVLISACNKKVSNWFFFSKRKQC